MYLLRFALGLAALGSAAPATAWRLDKICLGLRIIAFAVGKQRWPLCGLAGEVLPLPWPAELLVAPKYCLRFASGI